LIKKLIVHQFINTRIKIRQMQYVEVKIRGKNLSFFKSSRDFLPTCRLCT